MFLDGQRASKVQIMTSRHVVWDYVNDKSDAYRFIFEHITDNQQ